MTCKFVPFIRDRFNQTGESPGNQANRKERRFGLMVVQKPKNAFYVKPESILITGAVGNVITDILKIDAKEEI
jgi:hypothetical protein